MLQLLPVEVLTANYNYYRGMEEDLGATGEETEAEWRRGVPTRVEPSLADGGD